MQKARLDSLLVKRGLFSSVDEAARAVYAHEVRVGDAYASSPALLVEVDAEVFVKEAKRFVSRGGEKLQGALEAFDINIQGLRCIDIGSSTGGFTDCLLQAGAASVTCVDVNYGQLAWKVRQDERVHVFERTNIRTADPGMLGAPFDVIAIDVSFIGLASLAPLFPALSKDGTQFIGLVKPQFESRHGETERGIVRDATVRARTVEEVKEALRHAGFSIQAAVCSSLRGAKGNVEYLIHAVYEEAGGNESR